MTTFEIIRNLFAIVGIIAVVCVIGGYALYWAEMKDMEIEDEHSENVVG